MIWNFGKNPANILYQNKAKNEGKIGSQPAANLIFARWAMGAPFTLWKWSQIFPN